MFRLSFYPIADSFVVVVIVAAALLALLAIGPGGGRLSRGKRAVLSVLRAVAILLLLLAMLRPTAVYTRVTKQPATLVLMADQSRSMSVPDAFGGKTRYAALRQALTDAQSGLAAVAADYEVKLYGFDGDTHAATVEGGKAALPDAPEGRQTALGAALEDVLRFEAGKRLLGLVVLSDGAQRAIAPRDAAPQGAAARLKQLGFRLYAVPFGQARGLGQARDIAVKDLVANSQVFVKNDLDVSGQIRVDGYLNRKIPVRLLFETTPGKMEVVDQQQVEAAGEGQIVPVRFRYAPPSPGEFKLAIDVPNQAGELVTTNNQLSTFVQVLKGGLNVLYVEGQPRVEQKFIRRALDASPDIKVDYLRIDARRPETRPTDFDQRLAPGKYEVFLLGDIDSTAFTTDELKKMSDAVARGAGLMMLGGFHSFGPGGYAETPLAKVLPVTMDRLERQPWDEAIRRDLHVLGRLKMEPTAEGLRHFIMVLGASPVESRTAWEMLPPLEGANRFVGLAPAAVVLAAAEKTPLLVAHNFGTGRVLAFAGDSTWHWWMRGQETSHKRFWRQIILWLARKDQTGETDVWLRLDQRRIGPGEKIEFTVGAQSPAGDPIADLSADVQLVLPDGSRRPLQTVRQELALAGSVRDTQTSGDYAVEVTGQHNGKSLGSARARFLVYDQDLELDNAAADISTLENLAATTGGQLIAPDQLNDLFRKLLRTTADLEVRQETKKTFWDTWPFFLALVVPLGIEWYLRKRWGLA